MKTKNRIIKFRAYDKKNKRWAYFDLVDTTERGHYTLKEWVDMPKCQYTGLKDKNGKEIYEGDILQDKFGGVGEVWFGDARFGWGGGQNWGEIEVEFSEIEIIGNIYENKELDD